ncbi:hypothetical protein LI177_08810 [bacterium 210820-DFI.6.37]|nr:hypothetical protein [bacterium 210820-DFI.6.37]
MLIKSDRLKGIIQRAYDCKPPTKDEVKFMLEFDETSMEAKLIRATADDIIRNNSDNSAIILGQIGVDIMKCPGGCKFCTFGDDHTEFEPMRISDDELRIKVHNFVKGGDLYGLYLMTMHEYELPVLLNAVKTAREITPDTTQIWVNIGDTDTDTFKELKKNGVTGVYHVCRLNEGIDTKLKPEDRIHTMDNALEAGLELYTCLEPIGPEHTPEMLADHMFIGIERGIYQHAAMRRVAVPGTPLAKRGQISELRLAQIVAIVGLASFMVPTMAYLGVHEPNTLGYTSGANIITAESGYNPRDSNGDTSKGRGMDMDACRKMMLECGFSYLRRGDESKIPLTLDYIMEKASEI